jgi:hypothetical protein
VHLTASLEGKASERRYWVRTKQIRNQRELDWQNASDRELYKMCTLCGITTTRCNDTSLFRTNCTVGFNAPTCKPQPSSVPLKKAAVCIKINLATSWKQTCFYKTTARKVYNIKHSSNEIEDTGCSLGGQKSCHLFYSVR